ncbi:MAG: GspH/FimT family pseudopilin [Gammaproteobacteria bacterium]|nr:GspH/FimT family pseudopilin [Gammaproteobacteria bacterium]
MQSECLGHNRGFTLLELIIVIVILGILSVVGAAKFFNQSSFESTQYHQQILSAFRYAQKIAVASQDDVTICLTSNSYTLYYSSGACSGTILKHPSGQGNYTASGTSAISPAANYTYNSQGAASSTGAYSFSVGGHNISIVAATGYVHES